MEFEIRADRSPQGARQLVAERRAFVALLEQGMSPVEAARVVGVHPRTGRDWAYGRPEGRRKKARLSAAAELARLEAEEAGLVARRPGGKLVWERRTYVALLAAGMSNAQACVVVGVHPRTGREWRDGRPAGRVKPARAPAAVELAGRPISEPVPVMIDGRRGGGGSREGGRYLSQAERVVIADLLREGISIRRVAAQMSRSPSTISREVRRNRHHAGAYRPYHAHQQALRRRLRPRPGKIAAHAELRSLVEQGLAVKWSPAQISAILRLAFPDRTELHVSHESIYQALYVQGRGELRRELTRALRGGRAYRRPHRKADERRSRFTHPMVMISERPAEAADRAVPGHWEGDLIIGRNQASQIATLVERSTRYVLLVPLPGDREAATVRDALTEAITTLPAHLRRSLTWDQGSEMALHHQISTAIDMPIYFCDPHAPWQRGSNENTNGLLRQYFPKGTDLSVHSAEHLAAVAAELNGRPRQTLGWDTPAQRMAKLLAEDSSNQQCCDDR